MKRESLKKEIDNILKKHKISTDESHIFSDPVKTYELVLEIEKKTKLLSNDERIFSDRLTYGELLDIFYKEFEREKLGY